MRPIGGHAPSAPEFAAKLRTPFAVLGIRVSGSALTGVEYLPLSERAMAPTHALAARACRQIERFLEGKPALPVFRGLRNQRVTSN